MNALEPFVMRCSRCGLFEKNSNEFHTIRYTADPKPPESYMSEERIAPLCAVCYPRFLMWIQGVTS